MTMCRVLNVARARFYAWLHNPVSERDKDWTDPTPVDSFCPHDEACSKASGLTPPR